MSDNRDRVILFTAKEQAELAPIERSTEPLKPDEVAGPTVVSLVSSGTEVVGGYSAHHYEFKPDSYPRRSGYAAIFRVEEIGSEVTSVHPGDLVFAACNHRSYQRTREAAVVRVPEGLSPEAAVFARMIKISMPAYVHTRIRPPETVVVTGLGVVGLMAAQLAKVYGYDIIAVDPDERRRETARAHGIPIVLPRVPLDDDSLCKKVGFGIECSGHEQAVLDLCDIVKLRGEVSMVGVPWVAKTEMLAQKVLHSVFYNYVTLTSGWEWLMPKDPEIHSVNHHTKQAMEWLKQERIVVADGAYRRASPEDAQKQYQDILHARMEDLTVLFDWRMM